MAAQLPPKPPPSIPANQTLYVRNLNDKIPKEDLRRNLFMLFTTYGSILDIVALKTMKMRGQAHITFRDIQSATTAMRELQGYKFMGREMKIAYAKLESHTLQKLLGTFNVPTKSDKPAADPQKEAAANAQQSIFDSANPSTAGVASTSAANLPPKPPAASTLKPDVSEVSAPKSPLGKRGRDESEEESEDDAMAMDESDSD